MLCVNCEGGGWWEKAEGRTGPARMERRRKGSRNWQENLIGSGTNQESYFIEEKRTILLVAHTSGSNLAKKLEEVQDKFVKNKLGAVFERIVRIIRIFE